MGFLAGGKLYLTVFYDWTPSSDELDFLLEFCNRVSADLYKATEGKHSIGAVYHCTVVGKGTSNIFVDHDGDSLPSSTNARLWWAGHMISAFRKTLPDVTAHVHELAHYLYDIGDEYSGTGGCVQLLGPPYTVCLMENYADSSHSRWVDATGLSRIVFPDTPVYYVTDWKLGSPNCVFQQGVLAHFCWDGVPGVAGDHKKGTGTQQNSKHSGMSCWTVMADNSKHDNIPYFLVYPGATPTAVAVGAPAVLAAVIPLTPVERFALVIDRSGSMAGGKLGGVIFGSDYYIDNLEEGKEFALLSFADTPDLHAPLDVVPSGAGSSWRQDRKDFVDVMTGGGRTAIGMALEAARSSLMPGSDVAAGQSVILLSDGLETVATPPVLSKIEDLVASNVRVFPIGFGVDQNHEVLQYLATRTGGTYLPVATTLTDAEVGDAIKDMMLYSADGFVEDTLAMAFAEIDETFDGDLESVPFRWDLTTPAVIPGSMAPEFIEFPIVVSSGSTQCTMGFSWSDRNDEFDLDLVPPGKTAPMTKKFRRTVRGQGYAFRVLRKPKAGTWKLRIRGTEIRGRKFRVFGFQVHSDLRFDVHVRRAIVRPGDTVEIRVALGLPQAIPGARVAAWIRLPDGQWRRINLPAGAPSGSDEGAYVAELDTLPAVDGSYLVCVDAVREPGTVQYVPTHPLGVDQRTTTPVKMKIPGFRLRKLLSFVASSSGRYDDAPLYGWNSKPPSIPADQTVRVRDWMEGREQR